MEFLLQNLTVFFGLIVLAFLSWQKIEYGIMAIIFSLPLYLIRLEFFGIPTTFLEISIYTLFVVCLFKKNARQNIVNSFGVIDKNLKIGITLLLVGVIVSTIFSSDLRTSAGILKGWFFDSFLFFIILVSSIKTYGQKLNILKIFFLSGVTVAIVSLIYFAFPDLDGVSYDGRLHGFYLSPNHLAMYLAPALIIGMYALLLSTYTGVIKKSGQLFSITMGTPLPPCCNLKQIVPLKIWRWLNLFFSFIIVLVIYFTYSYAAWFAIVVSLFLLICFTAPPIKKKIFIGAIFLILIALFFSQTGTDKFKNLKNLSYRSSYNSRLMIWKSAWEIGKDNWPVGIGPGNFQKYYLDYQSRFNEPYLEWAVPQPHNIFLAFWLETGLLGFLGFIMILAWFFKSGLNLLKVNILDDISVQEHSSNSQDESLDRFLTAGLLSVMVYMIIHGLFDTTYWKNDLAIIFWLIIGLMVKMVNRK